MKCTPSTQRTTTACSGCCKLESSSWFCTLVSPKLNAWSMAQKDGAWNDQSTGPTSKRATPRKGRRRGFLFIVLLRRNSHSALITHAERKHTLPVTEFQTNGSRIKQLFLRGSFFFQSNVCSRKLKAWDLCKKCSAEGAKWRNRFFIFEEKITSSCPNRRSSNIHKCPCEKLHIIWFLQSQKWCEFSAHHVLKKLVFQVESKIRSVGKRSRFHIAKKRNERCVNLSKNSFHFELRLPALMTLFTSLWTTWLSTWMVGWMGTDRLVAANGTPDWHISFSDSDLEHSVDMTIPTLESPSPGKIKSAPSPVSSSAIQSHGSCT